MVLCFKPSGHIGFGPGGGLVCVGAERVAEADPAGAASCSQCLDAEGCADIPGKGLLHRPPPGVAQKRISAGEAAPYALAMGQADFGAAVAPVRLPAHMLNGQHGMRLRLAALSTVVLRC
jgi:hypothetical protein